MSVVSMTAAWFKCVTCGAKVIVSDYYYFEARRLTHQHKCQGCAEDEVKTVWNS